MSRRRAVAIGVAVFVVLVVVFGVVSRHVSGSVTSANVTSALARAIHRPGDADCSGSLAALRCSVHGGSGGISAYYLAHAAGSCWTATRQANSEASFPESVHGCVRLWDDIFPSGLFG